MSQEKAKFVTAAESKKSAKMFCYGNIASVFCVFLPALFAYCTANDVGPYAWRLRNRSKNSGP